jgi:hypothetical protein
MNNRIRRDGRSFLTGEIRTDAQDVIVRSGKPDKVHRGGVGHAARIDHTRGGDEARRGERNAVVEMMTSNAVLRRWYGRKLVEFAMLARYLPHRISGEWRRTSVCERTNRRSVRCTLL